MKTLFDGVYAPSTIGTLLREFTFGHARQLESVLREHLVACASGSICCPAPMEQAFVDIDSLLRPVYGHAKQGASYGHTKIAGKQILRKGLSPLATTISTRARRAGDRRDPAAGRAGRLRQGRGPHGRPGRSAPPAPPGSPAQILVRGDSAYGNSAVVAACRRAGARFSLVLTKNPRRRPRRSPRSPRRLDPGALPRRGARPRHRGLDLRCRGRRNRLHRVRFHHRPVTARLIVRRVKDARYPDALFPVWRYHPFFTDTDEPVDDADITHRRHAIIETVFADLIDGPLAHMPSGRFGANSAWILCAAITHNLLRAAGILAGGRTRRGPRRHPAPHDRQRPGPAGPPPTPTRPAPTHALALGTSMARPVAQHHRLQPTTDRHRLTTRRQGPTGTHRKSWADQQIPAAQNSQHRKFQPPPTSAESLHGSGLSPRERTSRRSCCSSPSSHL